MILVIWNFSVFLQQKNNGKKWWRSYSLQNQSHNLENNYVVTTT